MSRCRLLLALGAAFWLTSAGSSFAACDALKPFAGQTGELSQEQAIDRGRPVFEANCAVCHGMDASGGRGPNLRRAHLARAPDDAALCELIETGIPPEMPDGTFLTDEDVRVLVAFVSSLGRTSGTALRGDPARGAAVFATGGCASCHILAGRGAGYGPELTGIGERRSVAYLREVLRDPPSRLPAEFLMLRATTGSGDVIEGIRLNEDNFSVQIRDASGAAHSLDKSQLRSLERLKGQTPMPSLAHLPASDLEDLVAYLVAPVGGTP